MPLTRKDEVGPVPKTLGKWQLTPRRELVMGSTASWTARPNISSYYLNKLPNSCPQDHHFLPPVEQPIIPIGLQYNQQEEFTILDPSGHSTPAWQSASPSPAPMSSTHQSAPPESAQGNTTNENPTMNAIKSVKAQSLPRLSINLSSPILLCPSQNSRNLIHSMVLTPRNSETSFISANWILGTKRTCSRMEKPRSIMPFCI